MTLDRSKDYDLIQAIIQDPRIYDRLSDDGSPKREDFRPIESDQLIYLMVRDDRPLGLFMFVPQNAICIEVHTCLLPESWGSKAKEAGKRAGEWIFTNTPFRRIVTNVPRYNRLALRFAEQCGMTTFGVNPKSYLKNGELHDQIMLGMSKE